MRRSIFGKMVLVLLAGIFISTILTGVFMSLSLKRYMVQNKAEMLKSSGNRVISTLQLYLENQKDIASPILFNSFVESMSSNASSLIWIVLADGTIVLSSQIPEDILSKMIVLPSRGIRLPDERQYAPVDGEVETLQGDFYGLFAESGIDWLTVKIPFLFQDKGDLRTDIDGFVMLHARMPEINESQNAVFRMFLLASLAGIAVAIVFGFIVSRRISAPIRQMNVAARRIASGEFQERLKITGHDETWQLAESFNHMVSSLEQLEKMRRDFVSNVSHELRTPITTIKGFVEGILDGTIPPERQGIYLAIVRDEINRMKRLVNDLLDLTKMEAGESRPVLGRFDINELVRICVINLQQQFLDKDLTFDADFESERLFVKADKDGIQRVILNLLQNAIKFTPQGGLITVQTRVDKDFILTSVTDTGIGIAPEEQAFVFDRFFKADKSRSADRSGVGLGLAIARNIITAHGGTIYVESTLGVGSTFIFSLSAATEILG